MTDPDSDAQLQPGVSAVSHAAAVPATDAVGDDLADDRADDDAGVELREADDVTWRQVDASVTTTALQPTELAPDGSQPPQAPDVEDAEHGEKAVTEPAGADPLEDLPETVQLDLLDIEPTGDPRVDAALERVRDLAGLPVADHPDVYEDVHRRLQSALADLGPDR